MNAIYILSQAKRPEQETTEKVAEFTEFPEAQDAGRTIIHKSTVEGKGPNFVDVRWDGRMVWCAWVKPKVVIQVAHLLDES